MGAVALRIAGLVDRQPAGIIPLASFHLAFAIIGVIALLAVIDAWSLHRYPGIR